MKNAYIYPFAKRVKETINPYPEDFAVSLFNDFRIVNWNKVPQHGILDILKYIWNLDIVFFNWIEELPTRRSGNMQTFFFFAEIALLKLLGIKIFYTLHNKESHYAQKHRLKWMIKKYIIRHADFILCHASEGLGILQHYKPRGKILYLPHPFKGEPVSGLTKVKDYDILIWGTIRPYKAIDQYLQYLEEENLLYRYKTMIVGEIIPPAYENVFKKYHSETISILNQYIDDDSLTELIHASRIILFTYSDESVLSSGALIYSLSRGAFVIGPDTGSFRDLNRKGLIEVYTDYHDLIEKIDAFLLNPVDRSVRLSDFILQNTWEKFGANIAGWIEGRKMLNEGQRNPS